MKLDSEFIEAIIMLLDQHKEDYVDMKRRLDGMKVCRLGSDIRLDVVPEIHPVFPAAREPAIRGRAFGGADRVRQRA